MRRARETSSSCIRSRSLGLVTSPRSMRSWSRTRRDLTCSTSASAFFCSRVRSSTRICASRAWLSTSTRSAASASSSCVSGRCASRCRSVSSVESSSWTSSSLSCAAASAFSGCSWVSVCGRSVVGRAQRSTRNVHGSVTRWLTRVSTVSPRSAQGVGQLLLDDRQPGPLRRPVRDVDQRRTAVLEELAGPVVAQVGGEVHVGVGAEHGVEHEVARPAAHHDGLDRAGRGRRRPGRRAPRRAARPPPARRSRAASWARPAGRSGRVRATPAVRRGPGASSRTSYATSS